MEREFIFANDGSTKQWVEPESTNVGNSGMLWETMVTRGWSEFRSERVDMLSQASIGAQSGTTQLPSCAESGESHSIFFALVEAIRLASNVAAVVRRPKVNLGQTTTLGDSEREGRIGLDCLSVNPKRARMGSLWVLDCTLYILLYMRAAQGYP